MRGYSDATDGHWLVTFQYNGRLEGKAEMRAIHHGLASDVWPVVEELEKKAVRYNGALFWRGYSVEGVERLDDAVHP